MITAEFAVTKPLAGVIVASPATAPEHSPSTLGFPRSAYSMSPHTQQAAAAESVVATNAVVAIRSDATALPALKPYQPTHSIPVPAAHSTIECGGI